MGGGGISHLMFISCFSQSSSLGQPQSEWKKKICYDIYLLMDTLVFEGLVLVGFSFFLSSLVFSLWLSLPPGFFLQIHLFFFYIFLSSSF